MILLSVFHMANGFASSVWMVCALRVMHGAISSAIDPLSYSLVSDYFHKEKRSQANSILSSGTFLGIALSSMSILLIKGFGWRAAYLSVGGIGILSGLVGLFMPPYKRK